MAKIQTTVRIITVKETTDEVFKAMQWPWVDLIEDTSFYGELTGNRHESERKIKLYRECILEIYE